MTAARAQLWFKRTMWLLALTLVIFVGALWLGWPHLWIAPTFSFVCAEITRRICAESNPSASLRWRDIFRVLRDPASAPVGEANPGPNSEDS